MARCNIHFSYIIVQFKFSFSSPRVSGVNRSPSHQCPRGKRLTMESKGVNKRSNILNMNRHMADQ
jgi:hypothetical protein